MKKIKNIKFILCLLCFFTSYLVSAQSERADSVIGIWIIETGDSKIEIIKNENGSYNGILLWVRHEKQKSNEGCIFIKNLVYDNQKGTWVTDYLYSPEHKTVAKGILSVEGDKLFLKGRKFGISDSRIFYRQH